ncbi:MAG: hypothetical protein M1828_002353 [Chrysothrix sp. TS-e1954]|nr:MAG: hypothetical protein M1828_002353 [Chrysothrix sp. TS-e1954]
MEHANGDENGNGETFSPIWFTLSMNTGILSILLHQLPYNAQWMRDCSSILFVFNLLLFTFFTIVHIIRLIRFPRSALQQANDAEGASFWACAPIALLTIVAQLGLTASQASWGSHAFTVVAYVFWWFAQGWVFCMAPLVYLFLAKTAQFQDKPLSPAIILPAVGVSTASVVGATVANFSHDMSARLAVPLVIWGYMLNGIGAFLAFFVYALFLQRMFVKGIPEPAKIPSLMLLVGPMGQAAGALMQLGTVAEKDFGSYQRGKFLQLMSGDSLSAASVMLALMFVGLDIFFVIFALYPMLEATWKRQLSFSMVWWSTIFPNATLNLAFIELSVVMDSPTFRVLAVGLFLILLIDYFCCWAFTIRGILRGNILDGRQESEKRD